MEYGKIIDGQQKMDDVLWLQFWKQASGDQWRPEPSGSKAVNTETL